jgi:hypothetical protein
MLLRLGQLAPQPSDSSAGASRSAPPRRRCSPTLPPSAPLRLIRLNPGPRRTPGSGASIARRHQRWGSEECAGSRRLDDCRDDWRWPWINESRDHLAVTSAPASPSRISGLAARGHRRPRSGPRRTPGEFLGVRRKKRTMRKHWPSRLLARPGGIGGAAKARQRRRRRCQAAARCAFNCS